MTKRLPPRLLVAANGSMGARTVKALIQRNSSIAAIITTESPPGPVAVLSQKLGICSWHGKAIFGSPILRHIEEHHIDTLISVRFPYIFPPSFFRHFNNQAFNLHTGPLPKYAGLNAVNWALYNGEMHHGVTLHRIESGIDSGAILSYSMFSISEDDTGFSLTEKCAHHGIPLIINLVKQLSQGGTPHARKQDSSLRNYYGPEVPQKGVLNWNLPATNIVNFIRACDYYPYLSPWGHPQTCLNQITVEICRARRTNQPCSERAGTVIKDSNERILVASADVWVEIQLIRINDKYSPPELLLCANSLHSSDDVTPQLS